MLQIIDSLVDTVLFLLQQGRIKPCGGITSIQPFGERQFVFTTNKITRITKRLPEVTSKDRPLRFEERSNLQIRAASFRLPNADAAQTAPEPGISQCAIESDGLLEGRQRRANMIFGGKKKSLQRVRFRI